MWQLFFYKDLEERSLRLKAFVFLAAGLILIFFEEYTEGFLFGSPLGPAGYPGNWPEGQPRPLISIKIAALLSSGFVLCCISSYYNWTAEKYRKEFIEIEKKLEASRRTNEPVSQSKFSDSLLAALFFFGLGLFFTPFWLALPFCLFYYVWAEREESVMNDSVQSQSKIFRGEKRPTIQFTPKSFLVDIECPGCNAQMKVPELNKIQEVTCRKCGLSGEIEI